MSNKKIHPKTQSEKEHHLEEEIGEAVVKSEQFIDRYQKQLLIVGISILVIVAAIFGIKEGFIKPRNIKAQEAIFPGERYFALDSFQVALKGDGAGYIGFEAIIEKYSYTQTADLATAYAGLCHKGMGEFQKAIDLLKKFDGNDQMIAPAVTGAIGDCYVELGKTKEAIPYFEKAAKADNNMISPFFLKKAGLAYESLGEYKKAIEAFTAIKDKYGKSLEGQDIEKYIDAAQHKVK